MKVSIIGVGNMGTIFAEKLSEEADKLILVEKDLKKVSKFKTSPFELGDIEKAKKSDVIIVAVKPQNVREVLRDLEGFAGILISIVAGLKISEIEEYGIKKIVRVMPNVAVRVSAGVLAVSFSEELSKEEKEKVKKMLSKLGFVLEIEENLFPAITALTGSGPAFIFVLLESFIDAAVKMGIPFEKAKKLVYKLFEGSVKLVSETDEHPAVWKHRVTSPAGTTIEGIVTMERLAVRGGMIETLLSSHRKACELEGN
ncbi:pyrroline-5-carboxylate reductase [Thermotoga sp. KOL6]|uniref:pyrroline-5-carboxylate reductase n=1 Tax=Thermotoga sp. KOL6 TaxID=126741 RepID=UPI000C783B63|nr:pyrroline-5-carboxylate reductase [Thermotoga sp. KOL6]PLV59519.1 pyrroline-5-carboxylate reductase [Thermotoga sp. KOL6]